MSPKGSISPDILNEALRYLDQLNVFERRQDVPNPFGLLDVHGSRLQLLLLEYINSSISYEQSKWMITLGNTNATYFWQVGDRCHQNGCWKMSMTVEKDALLHFKHRHAFQSSDFDWCGIVPLINRAWKKYFARRDNNLEEIIYRGFFHLERRLLKEPVILKAEIRLDNEQLDNQNDPPLRTHSPIPASISTDNLTMFGDINPPLIFIQYYPLIWIHLKDQLMKSLFNTSIWYSTTIKWKISRRQESIKAKNSRWIWRTL